MVSLARQPGAGALDTVWAEDGSVFLGTAWSQGAWRSVWTPYAGYVHFLPRVLAEIAVLFPASWVAEVLAVEAALLTGAMAVLVFHVSGGQLSSTTARVVAAIPVVVLPLGQDDLPNAIANLHWPALYVTFWMLLWVPTGRVGALLGCTVAALTGASDIIAVLLAPVALARVRAVPGHRGWLPSAGLLLGLTVQLVVRLLNNAPRELSPDANPVWLTAGVVGRLVPLAVVGEVWAGDPGPRAGFLVAATVGWAVVVVVARAALTGGLAGRPFLLVTVTTALALYVVPTALSGTMTPRYAAAPAMLLVAAGAYVVSEKDPSGWRRGLAIVGVGLLLVVWAVNLRVDNRRADGPTWTGAQRGAERECGDRVVGSARVPITPTGWSVQVPCGRLP